MRGSAPCAVARCENSELCAHQWKVEATSPQKPAGSAIDFSYIFVYSSIDSRLCLLLSRKSAGTGTGAITSAAIGTAARFTVAVRAVRSPMGATLKPMAGASTRWSIFRRSKWLKTQVRSAMQLEVKPRCKFVAQIESAGETVAFFAWILTGTR